MRRKEDRLSEGQLAIGRRIIVGSRQLAVGKMRREEAKKRRRRR